MSEAETHVDDIALERLVSWISGIDLPMFIIIRRPSGRLEFVHANKALARVGGVSQTIFAGRSAEEIFPKRMAAHLNKNYANCYDSDHPVSYEECLMIDGRETWWQTTLSKPEGFAGQVIMGIAVATTDAKTREFAAAEAVAAMTARFEELQLFSTMAAHDARSPLATVSSLVDLVLDGFDDMGDGKVELLRLVSNTVDEALEQISTTLERSRALNGHVTHQTAVDLGRLCNDIAAMVDPEMALQIDVPNAHVECDAVVVQMGLRNLIANAARFAKGRIAIQLQTDEIRKRLVLDVADDGHGLPDGTRMQDLTAQGETRSGTHGFGLRSIAQLVKSRGGAFDLLPPLVGKGLPGARFRMEVPGRILTDEDIGPAPCEPSWAEAS